MSDHLCVVCGKPDCKVYRDYFYCAEMWAIPCLIGVCADHAEEFRTMDLHKHDDLMRSRFNVCLICRKKIDGTGACETFETEPQRYTLFPLCSNSCRVKMPKSMQERKALAEQANILPLYVRL